MFQRFLILSLLLLLIFGVGTLATYHWLDQYMNKPLQVNGEIKIEIPQGSNLSRFTLRLKQKGLLQKAWPVKMYAKLNNKETIIAGEYQFSKIDSLRSVLEKITIGSVIQYQIVFPEGTTYAQWLTILKANENLISTDPIDLKAAGVDVENPEGWFFPDTYYFHKGERDIDILARAHQQTQTILEELWQQRAAGLPYKTPYEALIMASIIEKETGVASERTEIAGVFVRRLQKGMRLQTDPTIIYGLGEKYRGRITRRHLNQITPYNTYKIDGLPPTPIAMPGKDAIYAALHPAEGDSLYFVAKGDGSHQFSATIEQHNAAVQEFQLNRKSDYRSTPVIKEP